MPGILKLLVVCIFSILLVVGPISARGVPETDVGTRRTRRQMGEVHLGAHRARLSMKQQLTPNGCREVGCGLIDFALSSRTKRANSDQRMAELQALIALSNGGGETLGHGAIDPYSAGKKKRSEVLDLGDQSGYMESAMRRSRLIRKLLTQLAERDLL
ncbi:hypothetical protein CAPTEDRAFT_228726 [Capitella teleta]|uniref:Corticotropin-releasing factor domain-containing protein n=1 Tax=Capitella teleta TaxID=283909 RepID=R7TDY4_CAPTE|nr:hypothetical protein CAPTEDRAFT_228726 [Capitella teleta]|eukprot:ELT91968.1 hypothetical protein CAPTEDRAFT_228726 [Capitella teleta]